MMPKSLQKTEKLCMGTDLFRVRPTNGIVKISVYNGTYFRTLRPEKVLQTLLTKDEKSGRRSTQGLL